MPESTGGDGAEDIDSWTFRFAGYHNQPAKILTTVKLINVNNRIRHNKKEE